jgi:WD40 repeat protein
MPDLSLCTRCGTEVDRTKLILLGVAKAVGWFFAPVLVIVVVALLLGPEAVGENLFFIIVAWVALFIPMAGKELVKGISRSCPACGSASLIRASSPEAKRLVGERATTKVLVGHKGPVTALAVLDDGRLASASNDNTIRIWDVRGGADPIVLTGHEGAVTALAALPGGRLVSGSKDKTIRVWALAGSPGSQVVARHPGKVTAVSALVDGRVASASKGRVEVSELTDPGVRSTYDLGKLTPRALTVAGGGRLAVGGWEGLVIVDPDQPGLVTRHSDTWANSLATLEDGRVACGSNQTRLLVLRLDDSGAPEVFHEGSSGQYDAVDHVAVLPNGRVAAYERHSEASHLVRVWDLTRATPTVMIPATASALAVLPDGTLALAGRDGSIRVMHVPLPAPKPEAEPEPREAPTPPVTVEQPEQVASTPAVVDRPDEQEPVGRQEQRADQPPRVPDAPPPTPSPAPAQPPPLAPSSRPSTPGRRIPNRLMLVAGVAVLALVGGTVAMAALAGGDDESEPDAVPVPTVTVVVTPPPVSPLPEPLPDFFNVEDSKVEITGCRARLTFVWQTDEPARVPEGGDAIIMVSAWTGAELHHRPVRAGTVTLRVTLPLHRGFNDFKGELLSIDMRGVNSLPRPFSVTTTLCPAP